METLQKIIDIVAETLGIEKSGISSESSVGDFPEWDSMGHLSILNKVEEVFEISFDPEEMMELEDVNDIVKAVKAKQ